LSNAYYIRIQAIEKHAKVKLFDRDRSGVHVIAVDATSSSARPFC